MKKENIRLYVAAMIQFGNKFLVRQNPENNSITLVGGAIQNTETANQAIIREVQTETGYVPQDTELKMSGIIKTTTEDNELLTNVFLIPVYQNIVTENQTNDKNLNLVWMTRAEMTAEQQNLSLELNLIFDEIIDEQEFLAQITIKGNEVNCEVGYV